MDKKKLSKIRDKVKEALSIETLTNISRDTGFTKRMRDVLPFGLVLAFICELATKKVEHLADLLRAYNALNDKSVRYKPFHNQLSKETFPEFMRNVFCHLVRTLVMKVLEPVPSGLLTRFKGIVIQDGSSFGLHDGLRDAFPGRFSANKPAAVELHVTMEVFNDNAVMVSIAPDTEGERDFAPDPELLKDQLGLFDRGYQDIEYYNKIADGGGFFIARFSKNVNPTVVSCTVNGKEMQKWAGKPLRKTRQKLRKTGDSADLQVEWKRGKKVIACRLVVIWNPSLKDHMYLGTNLDDDFDVNIIRQLYAVRWQIELLFKEWKSHSNLHAFATRKPGIAEGLIWASLCAASIKRFLAHATQAVFSGLDTSTRRVAKSLGYHLPQLVLRILERRHIGMILEKLLEYLKVHGKRANPKRDRKEGRLNAGLRPVADGVFVS